MSFSSLYRISFYVMLVLASLVMSVDASENRIAGFFPIAVAAVGVLAFLTVDRNGRLVISSVLLNALALGSVVPAVMEYLYDPSFLLLALGHWLIYLTLILMFRPKSSKEDWELFLLGLVQVMVGAVISQSDSVGAMLFCWAVLALWVLGLFSLQREAVRARVGPRALPIAGAGGGEDYPGLLNGPFLLSALRVTLTTLALGGVIFLAMPRRASMARSRAGEPLGQHLTGFDDEVQLGQLGEILENDNVVMTVELFDDKGASIVPQGEPLFRGVTMAEYEKGRWKRQKKVVTTFPIIPPSAYEAMGMSPQTAPIRQQIKLEPNDSNVLFGIRPMIDATAGRRLGPDLNKIDGTISRPESRSGTYDYEVWSVRDDDLPQPGEAPPSPHRREILLLGVPEEARPRLKAIAEKVIAESLPPERRNDPRHVARALEHYLRESGQFGYTLKLTIIDSSIDPVEDFLINRKEGHCEYFASALALLLRSVGIPSRMVNGFKGGDYNDLARMMNVRQKHAHSWVEAYLGDGPPPDRSPLWLTLDPTPGLARDQSIAKVGGFRGNFRQFTDLVRFVWVFYIVGYNAERQNKILYGPIRSLVSEAQRGFSMMAQELQNIRGRLRTLLHFENAGALISWRGFGVAFVGLLMLVGAVRLAFWLFHRLLRLMRGHDERSIALSVGAAHYRRLALLLEGYIQERATAETHEEFASRATKFLSERGSNTEAVADVPRLVVDAFYRVRFGHLDLKSGTLERLETRLDALESSLTASQNA